MNPRGNFSRHRYLASFSDPTSFPTTPSLFRSHWPPCSSSHTPSTLQIQGLFLCPRLLWNVLPADSRRPAFSAPLGFCISATSLTTPLTIFPVLSLSPALITTRHAVYFTHYLSVVYLCCSTPVIRTVPDLCQATHIFLFLIECHMIAVKLKLTIHLFE